MLPWCMQQAALMTKLAPTISVFQQNQSALRLITGCVNDSCKHKWMCMTMLSCSAQGMNALMHRAFNTCCDAPLMIKLLLRLGLDFNAADQDVSYCCSVTVLC